MYSSMSGADIQPGVPQASIWLQPLKTRNLVVSLPLDYPQFCPQTDPDAVVRTS
ncbi:MAG: hypothetical protein F6K32_01960 [Desertifilum sp. SIO1I2]|nr:hypothetical protein [Desertifilum sp. SIO1I2]